MHGRIPGLSTFGYCVQIFFVLSGYLISSILIREFDSSGQVSIKAFYIRRGVRLLPALWLMYVVAGIYAVSFMAQHFIYGTFGGIGYGLLFMQNWAAAYFKVVPHGWLGLMPHTWSLSVEWQFYFVWPFALVALKRNLRDSLSALVLAGAAALLTYHRIVVIASGAEPSYVVNATDMNLDGLMLGSALAFLLNDRKSFITRRLTPPAWGAFIALGLIIAIQMPATAPLFPIWLIHPGQLGVLTIEALTACTCWALVESKENIFTKLLAFSPLVYLGKISYGLYLWHVPIYFPFIIDHFEDKYPYLDIVLKCTLPVIVAACSYHFLERPLIRYWKLNKENRGASLNLIPDSQAAE